MEATRVEDDNHGGSADEAAAAALPPPPPPPTLVHDGESMRIYRHILQCDNDGGGDESSSGAARVSKAVAVKVCQPGSAADVSCLYNEYHLLTQMLGDCEGTRRAVKKGTFDCIGAVGDDKKKTYSSPAIWLEWVEGVTLDEWLRADAKGEHGTYLSAEEKVLTRVRLAYSLASAVASMHEAGVVHHDLLGDNVIVVGPNFEAGRRESSLNQNLIVIDSGAVASDSGGGSEPGVAVAASRDSNGGSYNNNGPYSEIGAIQIIDLGYAERSSSIEENDEGERVNDDMHALARLLRTLFGRTSWGAGSYQHSSSGGPFFRNDGASSSEFGRAFVAGKATRSDYLSQSIYVNSTASIGTSTDDETSTSDAAGGGGDHQDLMGFSDSATSLTNGAGDGGSAAGVDDSSELANGLPHSVLRVLADAVDHGHNTRTTAYGTAREAADDLGQLADAPLAYLLDPRGVQTRKSNFSRPPGRLCGRQKELEAVIDAFDRLADKEHRQRTEILLIAGRSGTGKSSLLRQLRGLFGERGGFFAMGKFDQLRSTQPYSALIVAVNAICDLILAEEADALTAIRDDILAALGKNGKVLTDVIPKLVTIVGAQPDVPAVRGVAARNRFEYFFRLFMAAVAAPGRDLCLCLDDIQWADSASMGLVRSLVNDESNKYLLFIGCYRDNEMHEDHPVQRKLDRMRNDDGISMTLVELGNMTEEAVNDCVSERLMLPRRLTRSLASIAHAKTLGNAFFVTQFLASLAEGGILTFSVERMRWEWDDSAVAAQSVSDNVVEVMTRKIRALPAGAQALLTTASCVGSTFEFATLQGLTEPIPKASGEGGGSAVAAEAEGLGRQEDVALAKTLQKLLKQGLINKLRRETKMYRFAHDRIQQASYSLLSEDERARMHVRIGRMFVAKMVDTGAKSLIFTATDQLNRGVSCIAERNEQIGLVRLNVRAGEQAYAEAAFVPAVKYLETGLALLGGHDDDRGSDAAKTSWNEHYNLTLQLYELLAEVKQCLKRFKESEEFAARIFEHAKNSDDRFTADLCLIKCYSGQGRWADGLNTGLDLVRRLFAPLPRKSTKTALNVELLKTKKALRHKTDDALLALPRMTDERILKVMKALLSFIPICRLLGSKYFAIITLRMVQMTVRFGSTDISAAAFSLYGYVLINLGDVKGAYRFGQLSLTLLEQFPGKSLFFSATHLFCHAFTSHWHDHIQTVIDPLLRIHQFGLEVGDAEYASYGILHRLLIQLHSGSVNIQSLVEEHEKYVPTVIEGARDMVLATYQATLNLAGHAAVDDPARLNGQVMTEDELLKRSVDKNNPISEYYFRMSAACVAYLFGDYERAVEHSQLTKDFGTRFPAAYSCVVQAFYSGLSSFAMARQTTKKTSYRWRKRGVKAIKQFQKWAKDCPRNNTHKVLLLQAENTALLGRTSKKQRKLAKATFNAAISTAKENGFMNDEAIAHERAAMFYRDIVDDGALFSSHMDRSLELYEAWGATAKVDTLRQEFSDHMLLSIGE